jgi:hypothetical protein
MLHLHVRTSMLEAFTLSQLLMILSPIFLQEMCHNDSDDFISQLDYQIWKAPGAFVQINDSDLFLTNNQTK